MLNAEWNELLGWSDKTNRNLNAQAHGSIFFSKQQLRKSTFDWFNLYISKECSGTGLGHLQIGMSQLSHFD